MCTLFSEKDSEYVCGSYSSCSWSSGWPPWSSSSTAPSAPPLSPRNGSKRVQRQRWWYNWWFCWSEVRAGLLCEDSSWNCLYLIILRITQGFRIDVIDYRQEDSTFESLEDWMALVMSLKERDQKVVLVDFIPNNTSDQHEWFEKSVAK